LVLLPGLALGAARSTFSHQPPDEARAGEAFVIEGNLGGSSVFRRLVAKVRGAGQDYEDFALALQYGDLYRATLPASRMVSPGIEYYIEGLTPTDERVALLGSADAPVRVQVAGPGTWPHSAKTAKVKCRKGKKCIDAEFEGEGGDGEPGSSEKGSTAPTSLPVAPVRRGGGDSLRGGSAAAARQSELEAELAVYAAEAFDAVESELDTRVRRATTAPFVLTAEQLAQLGVRHVHEALQTVPGLTVSRDVQGFWRVAVRGLRSDVELAFFLDGHQLNNFYDGRALGNLPIDTLERIEVYLGPAMSDLSASGALAAVHLWTNRQSGLRASASGGSAEAFDGHLSAAKSIGPVQLFFSGDLASQRGLRRPVTKDALDSATASRPKTTSDDRLLVNLGGGASVTSKTAGTFELSARYLSERRRALLGAFDVVGPDSRLAWQTVQGAMTWRRSFAAGHSLGGRLWVDQQETARSWQLTPAGFQVRASVPETLFPEGILEQSQIATRSLGAALKGEWVLPGNNTLSTGLDGELRSLVGFNWLTNQAVGSGVYVGPTLQRPDGLVLPTEDGKGERGPAADRLRIGVFLADSWSPLEVVTIHAGLRVDLTALPRADEAGQWTGQRWTPTLEPRVGVSLVPIKSLVGRLSYARRMRSPTVQELAEQLPNTDSYQGRFIGNPSLEAVSLDAAEASVEHLSGLGEARLRLRASVFFHRFGNPIAMVDNTGNQVPYRNRTEGVQALGAEGEVRLMLDRRTTAWANASWVRAEDLGTPASARLLTDVPQARFNTGFTVPLGQWVNADVVASFASERRNPSRSVLELIRRYTLPGYTTVTAQLRSELLVEHLELLVIAQNAFNFEYADDVPRPDRVTAGLPRETLQIFGTARVRW
jgi:outer membrane receptor for ferrienterochelin and colicin